MQQRWVRLRQLSYRVAAFYLGRPPAACVCLCVQISPCYKDTMHTGESTLMPSFKLDYFCKDPVSKSGYILRYWGLELQHSLSWGTQFYPSQAGLLGLRLLRVWYDRGGLDSMWSCPPSSIHAFPLWGGPDQRWAAGASSAVCLVVPRSTVQHT